MIDREELQKRLDWVYSCVAVKDRNNLSHELVWKDFPSGVVGDAPIYPAHWDVVFTFILKSVSAGDPIGKRTTEISAGLLLAPNGRSLYVLLFDLRRLFGVEVDVSEYPDFAPPPPVLSPIGNRWPRQGEGAYRVVGTDKWKTGDDWQDTSGIYVGEWRRGWFARYYVWVKQVIA